MRRLFYLKFCFYMTICGFLSTKSYSQSSAESWALGGTTLNAGLSQFSPSMFFPDEKKGCIFHFIHNNLYSLKELNTFKGEIKLSSSSIATTLAFSSFGYIHYRTNTLSFALAKLLTDQFCLGISSDWENTRYSGANHHPKAVRISIDGAWYSHQKNFLLYGKVTHRFMPKHSKNHLSSKNRNQCLLGFCLKTSTSSKWLLEAKVLDFNRFSGHTGFEYIIKNFSLRLGCMGLPIRPTYGVGFKFKEMNFNIGSNWTTLLGHSFSFDISYTIKYNNRKK